MLALAICIIYLRENAHYFRKVLLGVHGLLYPRMNCCGTERVNAPAILKQKSRLFTSRVGPQLLRSPYVAVLNQTVKAGRMSEGSRTDRPFKTMSAFTALDFDWAARTRADGYSKPIT
jgi:hypothetical protein